MRPSLVLAACTLLAALAGPAGASPLAGGPASGLAAGDLAEAVKWKGHKWKGGHPGRHYGWSRGKRKGHYKRARSYYYYRY